MTDFKQQIKIQNEATNRMILADLIAQRDDLDRQIEEVSKNVGAGIVSGPKRRKKKKNSSA